MSVQWKGEDIKERVRRGAIAGVRKAAQTILDVGNAMVEDGPHGGAVYDTNFVTFGTGPGRHVIPVGVRSPHQAGAPGEAPASDSGDLVRMSSVTVDDAAFSATAQWTSPEAGYMQYGTDRIEPRPFATLSLSVVQPQIQSIVNAAIKEHMG